ncbi:hypothetical protein AVEN_29314-1 [Araneus ventricosus]|uniref:Retrotransposon gag domain-containing protein n=1 Tax=Araneus ventricosus TaxID=182803 RepID=A0A4Y2SCX2_ARAVE|nr:hypothetical protein AVEN_29314-1 [Araneus ventricosus]
MCNRNKGRRQNEPIVPDLPIQERNVSMSLVELIPRFSEKKDSVRNFIKKIDEVGQLNNWSLVEKLTFLKKLKICDDAGKFVSYNVIGEELNDYDHVVNALILNFGNKTPLTTYLQELAQCKQEDKEFIFEFGNRIRGLGNSILKIQANGDNPAVSDANNSVLLAKFCSGLEPELQRQVLSKNPRTLDDAIESARTEDENFKIYENAARNRESSCSNAVSGDLLHELTSQQSLVLRFRI